MYIFSFIYPVTASSSSAVQHSAANIAIPEKAVKSVHNPLATPPPARRKLICRWKKNNLERGRGGGLMEFTIYIPVKKSALWHKSLFDLRRHLMSKYNDNLFSKGPLRFKVILRLNIACKILIEVCCRQWQFWILSGQYMA